jgi:hypothetical protein
MSCGMLLTAFLNVIKSQGDNMFKKTKTIIAFAALSACFTLANAATCGEARLLDDWVGVPNPAGDTTPPTGLASTIRFSANSPTSYFIAAAGIPQLPLTCYADGTLRSSVQGDYYVITMASSGAMILDRLTSGASSWKRSYYTRATTASYALGADMVAASIISSMEIIETATFNQISIITTSGVRIPTSLSVVLQLHQSYPNIPLVAN